MLSCSVLIIVDRTYNLTTCQPTTYQPTTYQPDYRRHVAAAHSSSSSTFQQLITRAGGTPASRACASAISAKRNWLTACASLSTRKGSRPPSPDGRASSRRPVAQDRRRSRSRRRPPPRREDAAPVGADARAGAEHAPARMTEDVHAWRRDARDHARRLIVAVPQLRVWRGDDDFQRPSSSGVMSTRPSARMFASMPFSMRKRPLYRLLSAAISGAAAPTCPSARRRRSAGHSCDRSRRNMSIAEREAALDNLLERVAAVAVLRVHLQVAEDSARGAGRAAWRFVQRGAQPAARLRK